MSFVLSNGLKFENENDLQDRQHLQVLVKRVHEDGTIMRDESESVKSSPDRRVDKIVNLYNMKTDECYTATDTYMLAVNEKFVDYPEIQTYLDGCFASNADYKHKVEIHILSENLHKKVYFSWGGNTSLSDFVGDLEDVFEEALDDNDLTDQGVRWSDEEDERSKEVSLGLWTNDGDFIETEIELRELINSIISIRVVEFSETINNNN